MQEHRHRRAMPFGNLEQSEVDFINCFCALCPCAQLWRQQKASQKVGGGCRAPKFYEMDPRSLLYLRLQLLVGRPFLPSFCKSFPFPGAKRLPVAVSILARFSVHSQDREFCQSVGAGFNLLLKIVK